MAKANLWRACVAVCIANFALCAGAGETARDADFYEFTIPWDHPGILESESDSSESLVFRRVLARDGRLVFEDGSPARFYGVAVEVSPRFPVDNVEDVRRFVRKLKGYGVNLVRLNGLDYPRMRLFDGWLRTGELDSAIMKRFDRLVAEIRNAGLYYAISINDVSGKIQALENVSPNAHGVQHKRFNFVQIFDRSVRERIAGWYEAFFGHENAFTSLTYASDPAHVYVTAINEDSIFNGYFGARGRLLSDENRTYLKARFNEYLADKYTTTAELDRSWEEAGKDGLGWGEKLERASVRFPAPDDLNEASRAKYVDVMSFLYEIDSRYASEVKAALDGVGFTGLFAVTNDWYGFESLKVNADLGDIIDMHGYFDHPIRQKIDDKSHEMVRNWSFIADPTGDEQQDAALFRGNFFKFFGSAVSGMPFFISEWNHTAWSEYAYEGPILLASIASLQGYAGIVIHTMFSTDQGYRAKSASRGLALHGNPVLLSLMPSLSLAFRGGYVTEASTVTTIPGLGPDGDSWRPADRALADGTRIWPLPLGAGFSGKTRIDFSERRMRSATVARGGDGVWLSETGEIDWHYGTPTRAAFVLAAEKFAIAAGRVNMHTGPGRNLGATLSEHGAVTLVTLDNQPLTVSRSLLLTAVSSFRNTAMKTERVDEYRNHRNLVRVIDTGSEPVLMRRVRGGIRIRTTRPETARVQALLMDGGRVTVPHTLEVADEDHRVLAFEIGDLPTSWYSIGFAAPTD